MPRPASNELLESGAIALVEPVISGPDNTLMSPGIVDVTDCAGDRDEEILAPFSRSIATMVISTPPSPWPGTQVSACPPGSSVPNPPIIKGIAGNPLRDIYLEPALTADSASAPVVGVGHSGNLGPAGPLSCGICARPVISHEAEMQGLAAPALTGLD